MKTSTITTQSYIDKLPPPVKIEGAREKITQYNCIQKQWIIVLDDDPTGCQTVHNIPIITTWELPLLEKTMSQYRFFFILTNSRAYSSTEAARINKEIIERLIQIGGKHSFKIISRSDSTLRGHFLAETTALLNSAGPFDGVILVPYFKEGGRFTVNDTHYVVEENNWKEAHETEFAKDAVFGYKHSWLPGWIEEKSNARWQKENVVSISLDTIRTGGVKEVYRQLLTAEYETPIIINALHDEDIEVVVLAICQAEQRGKKFLYRTAASFVKIRYGMADAPLYSPGKNCGKGIIMVGSYVQKTTQQLQPLLGQPDIEKTPIQLSLIFSDKRSNYSEQLRLQIENTLNAGKSIILYTERVYAFTGYNDKLAAGSSVSGFLSDLIRSLTVQPDFIIAKGGITSHDIASKGLSMKEAMVMGQIAAGIPVWKAGAGSKFPDLLYIVFPGNVGKPDTLWEVFQQLTT